MKSEHRWLVGGVLCAFIILAGSGFLRWRAQQAEWEHQARLVEQEAARAAAERAAEQHRIANQKLWNQKIAKKLADQRRRHALIQAAADGNVGMVRWLLSQGYDPNYSGDSSWTPLYATIERAYISLPHYGDWKELPLAAQKKWHQGVKDRTAIVRLLLRYGAKVNYKTKVMSATSASPLQVALRGGYEGSALRPVVLELLKAGANPNERFGNKSIDDDRQCGTPLGSISRGGDELEQVRETDKIIGDLLRFGAHLEGRDWWGRTPLLQSLEYGGVKAASARLLLKRGAKVNVRDYKKRTPLHCLLGERVDGEIYSADVDITFMKLLLECGVNPNARDTKGRTPLHLGVENIFLSGNSRRDAILRLSAVKLLLSYGANPHSRNQDGETPLHVVAHAPSIYMDSHRSTRIEAARLFIKRGVNINARDNKGRTPLLATLEEFGANADYDINPVELREMILFLLKEGANANARSKDATSALKLAPKKQTALRRLLVDWGAR